MFIVKVLLTLPRTLNFLHMTNTTEMTDFQLMNADVERIDLMGMPDRIFEHAIAGLTDIINDMDGSETFDVNELHHRLFNEDYFIIGTAYAEMFLGKCEDSIFEIIAEIVEYEKYNFGETNTEINAEAVANMYAYIKGEILLGVFLNNEILTKTDSEFSKSQMTDLMLCIKKWR